MQDPKIAIDTNVIVAASIIANIKELDTQIKHPFYDQSIRLFSVFRKRQQDKIGIAVPRVKSEAFLVLSKAIKDVFIGKNKMDKSLRKFFFDRAVSIINSCEHKMRELFTTLISTKPPEPQVQRNLEKVSEMANYIKNELYPQYNKKYKRLQETKNRSKSTSTEPRWTGEQKDEAFYAHYGQVYLEYKQLERFMRKYPNIQDQRILAEVITVKDFYCKKLGNYAFMVASCDSGFFSPYIWRGAQSNLVTNEIRSRFDIFCHQPDHIYFKIGGQHTTSTIK